MIYSGKWRNWGAPNGGEAYIRMWRSPDGWRANWEGDETTYGPFQTLKLLYEALEKAGFKNLLTT